jgi:hypothetical protein
MLQYGWWAHHGSYLFIYDLVNLTAICEPIVWENVGASTSHNIMGLHGLLQEWLITDLFNDAATILDCVALNGVALHE